MIIITYTPLFSLLTSRSKSHGKAKPTGEIMGIHGIQTPMYINPRMQCLVQNEIKGLKTISRRLFSFCIDSLGRNSFHLHSFLFRLIIEVRARRYVFPFYSALYKTSFTFLLNFLPSVLNSLLLLMPLLWITLFMFSVLSHFNTDIIVWCKM